MPRKNDPRRKGDERPRKHVKGVPLTLTPTHNQPFRWLPRHGEPSCIGEWLTQRTITALAWLPFYTAVVATLVLLIALFGVPWIDA
jgi:hypothetical protein